MAEKSKFTAEQVMTLKSSPYVRNVTKTMVSFTSAFKQLFYEQRRQGRLPEDIFAENGIDPEILGADRIRGFAHRVEEQAARAGGFQDLRVKANKDPHGREELPSKADRLEGKIDRRKLVDEVAEMKREIEEMHHSITDMLQRWKAVDERMRDVGLPNRLAARILEPVEILEED